MVVSLPGIVMSSMLSGSCCHFFSIEIFEQLSESLQHLQAERDQYVHQLKEEGGIWQQRVQMLSEQVQRPYVFPGERGKLLGKHAKTK